MVAMTTAEATRHTGIQPGIDEIVAAVRVRRPEADEVFVRRGFEFAERAHRGQVRLSGDPFITHPLGVATIVAELGLDEVSVVAALLHDTVEDTGTTVAEVESGFGPHVACLVESLTKIERIKFDSKEAQQAATMRKLLVSMVDDWRVLVIKLADRLHNVRTAAALPEWKRHRLAQETLDIYAPLAHRLGIQEVKRQLEDLSFEILLPGPFREISDLLERRAPERDDYVHGVVQALSGRLGEAGIDAEVSGRPKHHWSIYEKMVVKGKEFNEIYDLVGVRIIVDDLKNCWAALGVVHGLWSPVQGRFKDYINSPKFNMYQSIHTTVMAPGGKTLEVQIRTKEMHRTAEYGVAAHWGYKEKHDTTAAEIAWLQQIVDWQAETPDPSEFLESLKLDLRRDEVYVFTPKGKVVALPAGSTPIDFAYAIHTDVGHRCIGGKVNGRLVPLDTALNSGETVEVVTSKSETAGPSRDWLSAVRSARARNKIRQWFSRERREDAIESGREELVKELRREGMAVQKLASSDAMLNIAGELGLSNLEALYAAVGEGHVSSRSVVQKLARDIAGEEPVQQLPTTARSRERRVASGAGVYVEGLDDMMIRLSKCCTPVPGDEIVGFVTRGRGVSVHRSDCANAVALKGDEHERMIEVEWDRSKPGAFATSIEVRSLDRSALLTDVARVISESRLNILSSRSRAGPDRVSRMSFEVEVADAEHLESVIAALKRLDCVYEAYRVLPGAAGR